MRPVMRLLPTALLAGALLLGGCGKKDEQSTRFNQTLGDTAVGAPLPAGPIDTGILKDQTAYKPADYEPLEPRPAAETGGAGGPEAEAIQTVLSDLIAAIFDTDIDIILGSFVPEQVAALQEDEFISAFYETTDTFEAFFAVLKEKTSGPELELFGRLTAALPTLVEPLQDAVTVTVLDEENAVATLDLGAFELPEELRTVVDELMAAAAAAMAQMGIPGAAGGLAAAGGAGGADAAEEAPSLDMLLEMIRDVQVPMPLRKIDDEWKLTLSFTFQEEHAELFSEGLGLYKDLIADITQTISEAETFDEQTTAQIQMQAMMKMGPIMGWAARAQMVLASLEEPTPAGETDAAKEPTDKVEEPDEPNSAEEPNTPQPPRGRGGRPRGP